MIFGQSRSSNHDTVSTHLSKPMCPMKDNRCSDCRLHDSTTTSAKHYLATCSHQHDFSPTPNRFSVLADLKQSPTEPKWAFDFVPTSTRGTRRRGKRGGKHHKSHKDGQKKPESHTNESISALCRRIAALRLNDDGPTVTRERKASDQGTRMAGDNSAFSFESDRPHWAPQFRPNSLSAPAIIARSPATPNEPPLPTPTAPKPCKTSPKVSPPCVEPQHTRRKESRFFPLSAFLACPDPTGRYPSKSKFSEVKPTKSNLHPSAASITLPSPTHAQKTAVSAACCALTLRKTSSTLRTPDKTTSARQEEPVASSSGAPTSGVAGRLVELAPALETSSSPTIFSMDQTFSKPSSHSYGAIGSRLHNQIQRSVASGLSSVTKSSLLSQDLSPTMSVMTSTYNPHVSLPKPLPMVTRAWRHIEEDLVNSSSRTLSPLSCPGLTDARPKPNAPSTESGYSSVRSKSVPMPDERKPFRPTLSLADHHRTLTPSNCEKCWCHPKYVRSEDRLRTPVPTRSHDVDRTFAKTTPMYTKAALATPPTGRDDAHTDAAVLSPSPHPRPVTPSAEQTSDADTSDGEKQQIYRALLGVRLEQMGREAKTTPMYTHAVLPTPPPIEPSQSPPKDVVDTQTATETDNYATAQSAFSTLYDQHVPPLEEDGWTTISRTHSRHSTSSLPSSPDASPTNPRAAGRAAVSNLGDEEDYEVLSAIQQYTQSFSSPASSWVLSPSPSPSQSPSPEPPSPAPSTLTFTKEDFALVSPKKSEWKLMLQRRGPPCQPQITVEDSEEEEEEKEEGEEGEKLQDYESI